MVEHWSRKPGVVSSILTGGIFLLQVPRDCQSLSIQGYHKGFPARHRAHLAAQLFAGAPVRPVRYDHRQPRRLRRKPLHVVRPFLA